MPRSRARRPRAPRSDARRGARLEHQGRLAAPGPRGPRRRGASTSRGRSSPRTRNAAITASPIVFTSIPSWARTASRSAWNTFAHPRVRGGVADAAVSAVEPLRSVNRNATRPRPRGSPGASTSAVKTSVNPGRPPRRGPSRRRRADVVRSSTIASRAVAVRHAQAHRPRADGRRRRPHLPVAERHLDVRGPAQGAVDLEARGRGPAPHAVRARRERRRHLDRRGAGTVRCATTCGKDPGDRRGTTSARRCAEVERRVPEDRRADPRSTSQSTARPRSAPWPARRRGAPTSASRGSGGTGSPT